jgi:antitoxin HicB
MKRRNKHIGPSLEDFLKEEGVLEKTRTVALKETLAWQVQQAMEKEKISKAERRGARSSSRSWQCLGDSANPDARGARCRP